jgi:hypothetical protein
MNEKMENEAKRTGSDCADIAVDRMDKALEDDVERMLAVALMLKVSCINHQGMLFLLEAGLSSKRSAAVLVAVLNELAFLAQEMGRVGDEAERELKQQ